MTEVRLVHMRSAELARFSHWARAKRAWFSIQENTAETHLVTVEYATFHAWENAK